ncbi:hypothetical protein [Sporosarcina sp. A2]|uniref:hypothetical protein n=1 Tax=Sporosarcina sp. A2 TaxID=3393449 RepID=UPI003D7B5DD5
MNPVVTENTRYENARKRSADVAYTRHADYAGGNEAKRNELAQRSVSTQIEVQPKEFQKLNAGLLKQVVLPLGETLDEMIASWRNVRSEALSKRNVSEVDHRLAAVASAKIMETEAQIALEDRMRSVQEAEASQEVSLMQPLQLNASMDSALADEMQKLYEQAAAAYSIQTNAKQQGYMAASPAYSLSA